MNPDTIKPHLECAYISNSMKKQLWFLIFPVVLLCVMVWTRRESWRRTDAEFRQAMLQQAKDGSKPGVLVSFAELEYSRNLGVLTPDEIEELLADVHLQPATKGAANSSKHTIDLEDFSSNSRDSIILYLELDGEQSGISTLDTSGDSVLQKWNDFELTPESVRSLKKRLLAEHGRQIEDFKRGG